MVAAVAKTLKRPTLRYLFQYRHDGDDMYERGAIFDAEWDDEISAWKDGQKRLLGRVVEVIPEPRRSTFLVLFESVRRYRVTDAIRKAAIALGMTGESVTPSPGDMLKFMQILESHGAKAWNL
jgi:hypothetical protein